MVQSYIVHYWPALCTTDLRFVPWMSCGITAWRHDVTWRHGMTSWRHVTSQYDVTTSHDVTVWHQTSHDVTTPHDVTVWHHDVTYVTWCHIMNLAWPSHFGYLLLSNRYANSFTPWATACFQKFKKICIKLCILVSFYINSTCFYINVAIKSFQIKLKKMVLPGSHLKED